MTIYLDKPQPVGVFQIVIELFLARDGITTLTEKLARIRMIATCSTELIAGKVVPIYLFKILIENLLITVTVQHKPDSCYGLLKLCKLALHYILHHRLRFLGA